MASDAHSNLSALVSGHIDGDLRKLLILETGPFQHVGHADAYGSRDVDDFNQI
jgi:hypothetical protein